MRESNFYNFYNSYTWIENAMLVFKKNSSGKKYENNFHPPTYLERWGVMWLDGRPFGKGSR